MDPREIFNELRDISLSTFSNLEDNPEAFGAVFDSVMNDNLEFENVGGSALEEFNKTINSLVSEPACEEASDSPACAMPEEDFMDTIENSVPVEDVVPQEGSDTDSSNSVECKAEETDELSAINQSPHYVISQPYRSGEATVPLSGLVLPYSQVDAVIAPTPFVATMGNLERPENLRYYSANNVNLDYFQLTQASNLLGQLQHASYPSQGPTATTDCMLNVGVNVHSPNLHPGVVASIETPLENDIMALGTFAKLPSGTPKNGPMSTPDINDMTVSLKFSSAEEANAWRPQDMNPSQDPTIPTTIEQKKQIVVELIKAMKRFDRAQDNEGMIKPFREQKHNPVRIEIACWNILEACILRHQRGPLLAVYEVKPKATGQIPTFRERIGHIIECLLTQKTICKHLLDPLYLFSFIDDPIGSKNRVLANKTLNKRKGEVMNAGKQVLGNARSGPRTNILSKHDPEDLFAVSSPFNTPHQEGSVINITNFPANLDSGILSSSPYASSMHVMPADSPAMSSPSENLSHSWQRGNLTTSVYDRGMPAPSPARSHRSGSRIVAAPGVGNAQGSLTKRGDPPHSSSLNVVRGLENTARRISDVDRATLARQYQAVYAAGTEIGLNHVPPSVAGSRRTVASISQPQLTSTISPQSTTSEAFKLSDAASGYYRKRSHGDSEGSEYFPSPQKRAAQ